MWIHVPTSALQASAQEPKGSGWPLDSLFQALARSCTLNAKRTRAQTWSASWKRDSWMKRLCGQIPEPLTAEHGVGCWIASLQAIPASHSLPPASDLEQEIQDTFGPAFAASLRTHARTSFSLRTFLDTLPLALQGSAEISKGLGTALRLDYSRRLKSARLRNGSGCSFWPTPAAGNAKNTRSITAQRSIPNPKVRLGTNLCDIAWEPRKGCHRIHDVSPFRRLRRKQATARPSGILARTQEP